MNQAAFTVFPPVMKGATSLLTSIEGLVPRAAAGDQNKFLTGGAVWTSVAAVADPTGHAGALLTTDGTTTSWTSLLVSNNSLKSATSANLTLGTTSFGTALTFTSATGAATFAAGVTVTGSILGSGGSAPSSTTTGSNVFTAGIATSGPIYGGSSINVQNGSTFGTSTFFNHLDVRNTSNSNIRLTSPSDTGFGVTLDGGSTNALALATTAMTLAGNLTVSGAGTSSVAGVLGIGAPATYASAAAGDIVLPNASALRAVNAAGTNTFQLMRLSNANVIQIDPSSLGVSFLSAVSMASASTTYAATGTGISMHGGSSITSASGVVTLTPAGGSPSVQIASAGPLVVNSATASTSTTTGALVVSGGLGVAGAGFFGTSINSATFSFGTSSNNLGAMSSGSASDARFTLGNSASNRIWAFMVGGTSPTGFAPPSQDFAIADATLGGVRFQITHGTGDTVVSSSTEATTGGAGSLTTAGGSFTTKTNISKHFSGYGTAPTGAVGAGAGTAPSAVTFDASANDASGIVSVTSGTLPTAAATVITVTFNGAYATAPHVILYPNNAATALLSGATMVYTTATTTTFVITAGASGLVAATAYSWTYHVIQ